MLLALQVPSKTVGDRKYPHLTSEETEAHELTSYKTQFSSVSTPLRCGDLQAKTTDLGCSQESWGLPRSEQILPQPGGGRGAASSGPWWTQGRASLVVSPSFSWRPGILGGGPEQPPGSRLVEPCSRPFLAPKAGYSLTPPKNELSRLIAAENGGSPYPGAAARIPLLF